jgi:hypothetical protein
MTNLPITLAKPRQGHRGHFSSSRQTHLIQCGSTHHEVSKEAGMNPAQYLAQATQGETEMIELEPGNTLEINLKEDAQGRDRVVLALQSQGYALDLTPHQARVLATELIMAVNRAEVRSNLKRSNNNMVRGDQSSVPKRGLFSHALAK